MFRKELPPTVEIGVTRGSFCGDSSGDGSSKRKKRATPSLHRGDNGPLQPETRYSAFLRAFVRLDNGSVKMFTYFSHCYTFSLKDLGTFSKCPQIYIKLTGFEDNDSGKLPFKYYLPRCCSF